MIIVCMVISFAVGFALSKIRRPVTRTESKSWVELPSGWSKTIDREHNAFAIQISKSDAYWWISRNGRTWIEGPAKSLDLAKKEIEVVLSEFMS
jgi:hypothetical protein